MKTKIAFRMFGLFLVLLSVLGCTISKGTPTVSLQAAPTNPVKIEPTPSIPAVPTITLTIIEDTCWISNLETTPYAQFRIDLVMNEKTPTESGYGLVSLEAGKTFADLLAWTSAEQPSWVVLIHGVHEFTAGTHTYSYDPATFSENALYHGEPLYLVCMRKDPDSGEIKNLGSFGPINLKK